MEISSRTSPSGFAVSPGLAQVAERGLRIVRVDGGTSDGGQQFGRLGSASPRPFHLSLQEPGGTVGAAIWRPGSSRPSRDGTRRSSARSHRGGQSLGRMGQSGLPVIRGAVEAGKANRPWVAAAVRMAARRVSSRSVRPRARVRVVTASSRSASRPCRSHCTIRTWPSSTSTWIRSGSSGGSKILEIAEITGRVVQVGARVPQQACLGQQARRDQAFVAGRGKFGPDAGQAADRLAEALSRERWLLHRRPQPETPRPLRQLRPAAPRPFPSFRPELPAAHQATRPWPGRHAVRRPHPGPWPG